MPAAPPAHAEGGVSRQICGGCTGCGHDVTWVFAGVTTGLFVRVPIAPGAHLVRLFTMTGSLGQTAEDAERWWQAYELAENDQAGELRQRADAGDEHARRQLASWLADQARTEEAIEVIRPLADAGDDVAELWLARWLADGDHLDELRQRAASGSYAALHELAEWLARHEHLDELRELVVSHGELLSSWLARQYAMRVVRLRAELGDEAARRSLERWLARLRERAAAGDEHARGFLAENPDWRQFRAEWAD
jgi:hypothetical protein